MSENKIAIVNSSSFGKVFPKHLERLENLGEVDRFTVDSEIGGKDLAEKLQGYNYIVASVTPFFTQEFFDHKDELKLITRHGIGYNNIDVAAATAHNTLVSIVPPLIERDAVAENNITNLLAVMRQTIDANKSVLNNQWANRSQFVGNGLSGKTVGVIGVGNIGSRISEILNYGFRCNVLGYDPYISEYEIEKYGANAVGLEELLENSDVICLGASLNDDNYHMISTEELSLMKENVYISNTARGALIDEEAMVQALQKGKIGGFATDVLEVEPGRSNHPYLQFENVIVTPHTAAYTMECLEGMGETCVTDCENVVKGLLPNRPVQVESSP
jgi:phosphoglycerate dehydrogenase-like enzyme